MYHLHPPARIPFPFRRLLHALPLQILLLPPLHSQSQQLLLPTLHQSFLFHCLLHKQVSTCLQKQENGPSSLNPVSKIILKRTFTISKNNLHPTLHHTHVLWPNPNLCCLTGQLMAVQLQSCRTGTELASTSPLQIYLRIYQRFPRGLARDVGSTKNTITLA
jgi:hypothetical protein